MHSLEIKNNRERKGGGNIAEGSGPTKEGAKKKRGREKNERYQASGRGKCRALFY